MPGHKRLGVPGGGEAGGLAGGAVGPVDGPVPGTVAGAIVMIGSVVDVASAVGGTMVGSSGAVVLAPATAVGGITLMVVTEGSVDVGLPPLLHAPGNKVANEVPNVATTVRNLGRRPAMGPSCTFSRTRS